MCVLACVLNRTNEGLHADAYECTLICMLVCSMSLSTCVCARARLCVCVYVHVDNLMQVACMHVCVTICLQCLHVKEEHTNPPTCTPTPSKPHVDFYFSKQRQKARQLGQPRRGLEGLEELGLKSVRQQLPTTQARPFLFLSRACVRSVCIQGYNYTYMIIHTHTHPHT